jgi:GMP synthase PP-ATPase subunit
LFSSLSPIRIEREPRRNDYLYSDISHHYVLHAFTGIFEYNHFQRMKRALIEPLRELFKDMLRKIGFKLDAL